MLFQPQFFFLKYVLHLNEDGLQKLIYSVNTMLRSVSPGQAKPHKKNQREGGPQDCAKGYHPRAKAQGRCLLQEGGPSTNPSHWDWELCFHSLPICFYFTVFWLQNCLNPPNQRRETPHPHKLLKPHSWKLSKVTQSKVFTFPSYP